MLSNTHSERSTIPNSEELKEEKELERRLHTCIEHLLFTGVCAGHRSLLYSFMKGSGRRGHERHTGEV